MNTARVQILVPTIRLDHWLDQAVESLLAQSLSDIRICVVTDGFTPEEVPSWVNDRRVELVSLDSQAGCSGALRHGVGTGAEEYIARLDADDLSHPDRIRAQVDFLDHNRDVELVGTSANRISFEGSSLGPFPGVSGTDVRQSLLVRNHVVASSVMFRRDTYIRAGGFDPSLRQMEDYDLWLRLALYGRVAVLDYPYVSYRLHPNQLSRGAPPRGNYVRKVLKGRRDLARELGVPRHRSAALNAAWLAAQNLRYYKVRSAGYDS